MAPAARRPAATASMIVFGPLTTSPPANTPARPVASDRGSAAMPGPGARLDPGALRQDRRVRLLADRDEDGVGVELGLGSGDRCPNRATVLHGTRRSLLDDTDPADCAVRPDDLGDRRPDPVRDPLALGGLDLLGLGRHLLEPAAIDDRHALGPAAERRAGRVHCGAAATDHDNPAGEPRRLAEVDLLEEHGRRDDSRQRVAGDAEPAALRGAGRQEDRVEALGLEIVEREVATHDRVEPEVDPETDDPVDLGAQDLPWQAVLRDADRHHPAGHRHRLHDGDAVAEPDEVVGGRHPGRPAADDRDLLRPANLGRFDRRKRAVLGGEALDRADRDRLVEHSASAGSLAWRRADPAAHRRERVDLGGHGIGIVVATVSDQPDIAAGIRPCRTGGLARGDRAPDLGLDHRRPDLPRPRALAGAPCPESVVRRHLRRLQRLARHRRPRDPAARRLGPLDPALAWRQRGRSVHGLEAHDDDRAFADADRAADALPDLDRVLHHPAQGTAADAGRRLDAAGLGPGHVEGFDRADVHAHAAVDTAAEIDLDQVAHCRLRCGLCAASVTARLAADHTQAGREGLADRVGRWGPNGPVRLRRTARPPAPSVGRRPAGQSSRGVTRQGRGRGRPGPPGRRPPCDSARGASRGCFGGGTWSCSR